MKRVFQFVCILCLTAAAYAAFMYGYVQLKFRPLTPVSNPFQTPAQDAVWPGYILFIHAVNSPQRARAKDARYSGMEMDINRLPDGTLVLAHDPTRFKNASTLQDVWSALKTPAQKTYWLDLKIPLTQADIDELVRTAAQFNIPKTHLFFETEGGETARLLTQNGFPVLLQTPDGFDEDGGDPARRAALNARLAQELAEYHPAAVAGSLGKYPYLRAYFPQINKAIYTSTTKRPSLKKTFLAQAMKKDPTVKIFMLDEYTALPF